MRSNYGERGSALLLAPAGMLILIILGAISVDSALAFTAQRELQNQAAAAANDAVTVSVDDAALQQGELASPDPARAEALVHRALDGFTVGRLTVAPGDVSVTTDVEAKTVTVRVEGDVPYVFASAVPGARHNAHVIAQSSAQLQFSGP